MPFAEQSKFMVNFTGGLNTEATPLNFPENSAQEIDNFDLYITGEVKRRLGLDFEASYTVRPETTSATDIANYAISTGEWKAVNGKGDINFLVVQIGLKLYIHDLGADPLSGTVRGIIDLSPFKTGEAPESKVLSMTFGEGIMVVANEQIDPVTVTYDIALDTFTPKAIKIQIRDFEGIEETVENNIRPGTLSADHKYNLRNQGWPELTWCAKDSKGDNGVLYTDPVQHSFNYRSIYPSNSDIFHACKAVAANEANAVGSYSVWTMQQIATGNTPAPKGHYLLDAFAEDRQSISGISGIEPGNNTSQRPSAVAFYAGRVWYAGVPDQNYTGNVYFSQSLVDPKNAGKCYQEFDPTAEDLNAILATDGGVLHLSEVGTVYKMINIGQDLIIIASNGVWAIGGDNARGNFSADTFSIRKITEEGAVARESIVVTEGIVHWWGNGGIWSMQGSQVDDQLIVERITRNTIQTFYDDLEQPSKAYVRGFYDSFDKKVYWLYNDTAGYDAINFRFNYNRALVLDMTLQAFYTYTFGELDTNSPFIAAMTQKTSGNEGVTTYDIFQGGDDVEEGGDDIQQDVAFESFANVLVKFLTFVVNDDGTYSYTFSELKDRGFTDWRTWDQEKNNVANTGVNYDSTIQSGWNNMGDLIRNKTITHITSFFTRTEDGYSAGEEPGQVEFTNPSGAYIQTRWEYTDLDVGQWTTLRQAYKMQRFYMPEDENDPFDYGYSVIRSKQRMRGRGEAFSVRYESEDGKDMQLLGYGINVRAGKQP